MRAWNSLPAEVKQSQTTHSFKYYLNKDKTAVPKYYYSKNRKAQILHTRLRTNCSSLNLDLFLQGITDSHKCRCGSIENSQHFFFHCPYYQQQRIALLNVVSTYHRPTLDLLLYGESSLSYDVNMIIVGFVIRWFICVLRSIDMDIENMVSEFPAILPVELVSFRILFVEK